MKLTIALLLFIFLGMVVVFSTIFLTRRKVRRTCYVSPDGSDDNPGTIAKPWKTIQHAADKAREGDSIVIRGGVYNEYIRVKNSGNEGDPITFQAYTGEKVIFEGREAQWSYGFSINTGVSYIRLKDLIIKNFAGCGIALWGENSYIEISGVEVFNCGTALRVLSGDHLTVVNSYFHNNNGPGLIISPGPVQSAHIYRSRSSHNEGPGGYVFESGNDILIEKCTADHNAADGFNSGAANTIILSCVTRENGRYGHLLRCEESKIQNCVSDSNGMAGILLSGGGSYELTNNLVVYNGILGDYGMCVAQEQGHSATNLWMVNNIFAYNYGGIYFDPSVFINEDYNIYWSREDSEISTAGRAFTRNDLYAKVWSGETGNGLHSLVCDPCFVDPAGHDYRLAKNSPAIDRGTTERIPATDLEGNPRIQGRAPDIGPYETAEGNIIPPTAFMIDLPLYSTVVSNTLSFDFSWSAEEYSRGVAGYDVQVRDGVSGYWVNWLTDTLEKNGIFQGSPNHTYYFRVRAKDSLGNWGNWSDIGYTVIPLDDKSPLLKYSGEWSQAQSEEAFLKTLHFSSQKGASVSHRFNGFEVTWISTKGPDRGLAEVYLDEALHSTVDLYSPDNLYRCPIFSAKLAEGSHTLRIEVTGQKNKLADGCRVDIDGIAVKL